MGWANKKRTVQMCGAIGNKLGSDVYRNFIKNVLVTDLFIKDMAFCNCK